MVVTLVRPTKVSASSSPKGLEKSWTVQAALGLLFGVPSMAFLPTEVGTGK